MTGREQDIDRYWYTCGRSRAVSTEKGFVIRTSSGRKATDLAREHLDLPPVGGQGRLL